jgi:hypothetical protein
VARLFTAYDYEALRGNVNDHEERLEDNTAAIGTVQTNLNTHTSRTDNPHAVTKAQVGLGSVDNYPTASQAEAEAGTATNRFMTPLRTKQYVDKRLLNNLLFRLNGGVVEYSTDGSVWNPMAAVKSVQSGTVTTTSSGTTVDVTISSVNTSKSVIILPNVLDGFSSFIKIRAALTSATNLRFNVDNTSPGNSFTLNWQVVEYY